MWYVIDEDKKHAAEMAGRAEAERVLAEAEARIVALEMRLADDERGWRKQAAYAAEQLKTLNDFCFGWQHKFTIYAQNLEEAEKTAHQAWLRAEKVEIALRALTGEEAAAESAPATADAAPAA